MKGQRQLRLAGLFTACLFPVSAATPEPDANTIIQRSVAALQADWKASPQYNYCERDVENDGAKTYEVLMILGSPYKRLVRVNGVPLSGEDQKQEQHKLNLAISDRHRETRQETRKRIDDYERDRKRDHQMMEELTKGFVFKLSGEGVQNSHHVYILEATPRPGYQPPNKESQVLTGMKGTLWIDKATYQWVKAEAEVVHPVSIEGFLAKVEPGTRFEFEKAPVPGGPWLPAHLKVESKAKILNIIGHNGHSEETFFNYRKAAGHADSQSCQ